MQAIGRRAFTVAMATTALGTGRAEADLGDLQRAATREGTLTWYTAHTDGETAEATGAAFTAKYPGVKVAVVRTTAQVAYQRLLQEIKAGLAQCDVFSSTDLGHDEALRAQGKFARFVPENAGQVLEMFRDLDPAGTYYPTSAVLVLLTYNTNKVQGDAIPKNWPDLLLPRWRNQVTVGHPAYSGFVGTWAVLMRKLYGWEYFEQLERNRPLLGRSVNDSVTVLNSGERSVAMGPSGTTLKSVDRGNPVALSYPTDGALLMISPSAVMANAPHPNAARLFMEFLLSREHAELSVRDRNESLRPEVLPLPGARPFSEVKIIRPTTEDIVRGIPEIIEKWRDTFG